MGEHILTVDQLHKSYGSVQALNGVSLMLEPGEIVGLLGPNGAGKTTLVSIICGLRRADSGSVTVKGIDALAHPGQARAHLGLAPQELGVYPIDTVRQNISLFGELAGLHGRPLTNAIDRVAAALRLDDLMDRKAGTLSGGQKRRLHTALAIVDRPALILLDEPTVGADVDTRAALIEVVNEMADEGSAVMYSTHYLHEIEALDARVVIVDQGEVIAEGELSQLVAANGATYVELTFDGSVPSLGTEFDAHVDGSVVRVTVNDAGRGLARIMTALGSEVGRLEGVEIIKPSLEAAFLSITGRRYDAGDAEEVADVVAS